MSILHADQNISRCPKCGGWRWLHRCRLCLGLAKPDSEVA